MGGRLSSISWGPLLRDMRRFYLSGTWRVPVLRDRGADPFKVLVSTLLSQRTRDEVTERATRRLLEAYPTAKALARAPVTDIASLIREAGLSRQKAEGLRAAAKAIVEKHGGRVPRSEKELRELTRVGPKTARAVLVFGFEEPALPVDTHIHRVANRLGAVRTTSLEETGDQLRSVVPRRYWKELNPVLVQHGQNLCSAINPKCSDCPISDRCPRIGVSWQPLRSTAIGRRVRKSISPPRT